MATRTQRRELEKQNQVKELADIPKNDYPQRREAKRQKRETSTRRQNRLARRRARVAVPKGKTLAEVKEMDEDDAAFKATPGRPREKKYDGPTKDLSLRELQRRENSLRDKRAPRARSRKAEAEIVKSVEELGINLTSGEKKRGIGYGDKLIAEGHLDVSDWSNAELIRGYRRGRNGWGAPPKYVPRAVMMQITREITKRGNKALEDAYIPAMVNIADMASGKLEVESKIQLEAIKFVADRVAGKVPDTLRVGAEAPWQDMLADSVEPVQPNEYEAYVVVTEDEFHRDEPEAGDVESRSGPETAAAPAPTPSSEVVPSPALPANVASLFDDEDVNE